MKSLVTTLLLSLLLLATSATSPVEAEEANPAAVDFDHEASDPKAIAIADRVMQAMGGRAAWDATHHLRWRFFGRRLHVWDKYTGDIRIEWQDRDSGEPYVILMNISTKQGRAWTAGSEITDSNDLSAMLDRGESMWINDSYWMFMPYKLKDSGVTLKYVGESPLPDGREADVLELTFHNVGRTPENKYHVSVSQERHLVEQWSFFGNADDPEPRFTNPWGNWQRYGAILLSDNRGDSGHSDLAVFETLPSDVYSSPSPVEWSLFE